MADLKEFGSLPSGGQLQGAFPSKLSAIGMMMQRQPLTSDIEWHERPGNGTPLICLHGIGSLATTFAPLAERLGPDLRVIAWNAPGYGRSRPLASDWPLAADYADALLRFCDGLKLDRVHVLGHSLGTLIGASFAAAYPNRVSSLTLASCAHGRGTPRGHKLSEIDAKRLEDLDRLGVNEFARIRSPRLVFEPGVNHDLVEAVRADMTTITMPGYGQAVRMLASGDLSADCTKVQVPTSVIVGLHDQVTPPEQSRAAYQALVPKARSKFVSVPNCGHALHRQAPDALAATIALTIKDAMQEGVAELHD
ncbi:alpha/beta fold hydrolase [Pelagibacterium lentulum]|uniref:alpha/beta fold hydrolase n=1 Tax=Pelagibacterium lentulum TaxID=2029865 RepID=UPI001FCEE0D8|nr:alpha/beta hydrolase [Pelagibacterium lentulum]